MKLGKKSLNLVGFGVGIHETREKKIETWRVLVVFMKRWRPVDRSEQSSGYCSQLCILVKKTISAHIAKLYR